MSYGAWMDEPHALATKRGRMLAEEAATPRAFGLDHDDDDATPRGQRVDMLKLPAAFGFDDTEEDSVRTPRTTSQGGYTATWARLCSPSPRGGRAEGARDRGAARVEWRQVERGLPALPRAWRTPDPSPLRDGGEVLLAARLAELAYADEAPSPKRGVPPPPTVPHPRRPTTPRGRPASALQEEAANADPPPSAGSCGHPDRCGAPCKYFWKASGCKDGAACERCHLCKWVRPRKKPDPAPVPVLLEIARVVAEPRPRLLLSEMVF